MKTTKLQAKSDFPLNNSQTFAQLNCLVTGFDPFENQPFNPSEEIVNRLQKTLKLANKNLTIKVDGLVLPTCGKKAWPLLKPILDKMAANGNPNLVLMFGLAALRKNANLERFAINIKDGERKDNYGHVYEGELVESGAPESHENCGTYKKSALTLAQKGLPAEISNFCGAYVCNEIYFHVLRYFEKKQQNSYVSFVHLPLPKTYGQRLLEDGNKKTKALGRGKKNQLLAMQLLQEELIDFYANSLL